MKSWLTEILACPIDKHFPLELHIFGIEDIDSFLKKVGNQEEMKKDLSFFFKSNIDDDQPDSNATVINFDESGKELLVFDTLVRKPSPPGTYLERIQSSIDELKPIEDHSNIKVKETIDKLLALSGKIKKARETILEGSISEQKGMILDIEADLIFLNWFKQAVEIETGVMTCSKCHRWFPIRDSIPQMLPDELRKEKYDKQFLETWKAKLDPAIVNRGIPFHL